MSLYAEYLKERLDYDTVEIDGIGFASYKFLADAILVAEIFVRPENRKQGFCRKLVDKLCKIASDCGLEYLVGQISVNAVGMKDILAIVINHGGEILNADGGIIYFRWRIKNG